MRPLHIAAILSVILGAVLYATVFYRPETTFAALVPDDALYSVHYRSGNDLRAFYEGPYARRDLDPFRRRIGERSNVPELNGVSYIDPAGVYLTAQGEEVILVPYSDFRAFKTAWETEREDVNLRPPRRPASNYLSVSQSPARARIGDEDPLVRRAIAYPVSLVGRPAKARAVPAMLLELLGRESRHQPNQLRPLLLSRYLLGIPAEASEFVALAVDRVLVGIDKPDEAPPLVFADLELQLDAAGPLGEAPGLAGRCDLGRVVGSFPMHTRLLMGGVLPGSAWTRLGMPLPIGDGALAFAIVEPKERHPRPYAILIAAQPADPADLARLEAEAPALIAADQAGSISLKSSFMDKDTTVRTRSLAAVPSWLATPLRTNANKAPPIYLSTAVEDGIWYAAIGSQAERVVRNALGCLRGAEQLSIRASFKDPASGATTPTPIVFQRDLFRPHGVLCGVVTPRGLHALQTPMPYIELGAVGQPGQISIRLDADENATMWKGRIVLTR